MPRAQSIGNLVTRLKVYGRTWRNDSILAVLDRPWARFGLLFCVLILLMPPDGVLSDNEENYFQLAAQTMTGAPGRPNSAVFDSSSHRYASELLLGSLISVAGYETAQIITHVLTAAAFALVLPLLFRTFALSIIDGAIAVVVFDQLNQSLMGGEWIFSGFESKVVAYALIVVALYLARTRRGLIAATALCVTATYFHFLVGIFWFFALLALRLIENRKELGRVAVAALAFIIGTAPQTGMILWTRLTAKTTAALADTPTPDVIFSLIREPWHGAPFVSRYVFVVDWLPGYMLAAGMLAGCILIARTSVEPKQRAFAKWLALLIAYLFAMLVPAFIERHSGSVGKFYPFRPSSLVLLLWLMLAIAWVNGLLSRPSPAFKLVVLALVAPALFSEALLRVYKDLDARAAFGPEKQAVANYLSATAAPDAVVLIDPAVEFSFPDFERLTGRPSLISWKFAPTNDPELRRWYRLIEFRKSLFRDGCPPHPAYRVDFLLATPGTAAALSPSCGAVVLQTDHWRLVQRTAVAD